MTTRQPEALDLADWLIGVGGGPSAQRAAALLRSQHARITELEAQLEAVGAGGVGPLIASAGFSAADMATAAAQGFRDGVSSVSTGSASMASYAARLLAAAALVTQAKADEALRFAEGLTAALGPADGESNGWISVDERLPEPDEHVLAHNGKWTGVAAWMSGEYLEPLERWQDEHRESIEMMGPAITHWMPLPPAPTSAEGVEHG